MNKQSWIGVPLNDPAMDEHIRALLPMALDVDGLWWAASAAEALAFVVSIGFLLAMKGKYHYFDKT